MNKIKLLPHLLSVLFIICSANSYAQKDTLNRPEKKLNDSGISPVDSSKQRDLADEIYKWLGKTNKFTQAQHSKRINFSVVPSIGYTLSTGFALDITGNAAFYTSKAHTENLSAIVTDLAIDTKKQKLLISRAEIWSPNNDYKFVSDVRFEEFPTTTYGLGSNTTNQTSNDIYYDYFRLYGTLYKKLIPDFYAGVGYNLDYHYDITEDGNLNSTESDFKKYGESPSSTSSGLNLDVLLITGEIP
jgi:hypothetical protein